MRRNRRTLAAVIAFLSALAGSAALAAPVSRPKTAEPRGNSISQILPDAESQRGLASTVLPVEVRWAEPASEAIVPIAPSMLPNWASRGAARAGDLEAFEPEDAPRFGITLQFRSSLSNASLADPAATVGLGQNLPLDATVVLLELPEPASGVLLVSGLVAFGFGANRFRRRRGTKRAETADPDLA